MVPEKKKKLGEGLNSSQKKEAQDEQRRYQKAMTSIDNAFDRSSVEGRARAKTVNDSLVANPGKVQQSRRVLQDLNFEQGDNDEYYKSGMSQSTNNLLKNPEGMYEMTLNTNNALKSYGSKHPLKMYNKKK